jgi:phosphopentomutase
MGKFVIIVMDSVGIGALPDASRFGDEGSDTLGHIIEAYPDIRLDNLAKLGMCMLKPQLPSRGEIAGSYGRARGGVRARTQQAGILKLRGWRWKSRFLRFRTDFRRISSELLKKRQGGKPSATIPLLERRSSNSLANSMWIPAH